MSARDAVRERSTKETSIRVELLVDRSVMCIMGFQRFAKA